MKAAPKARGKGSQPASAAVAAPRVEAGSNAVLVQFDQPFILDLTPLTKPVVTNRSSDNGGDGDASSTPPAPERVTVESHHIAALRRHVATAWCLQGDAVTWRLRVLRRDADPVSTNEAEASDVRSSGAKTVDEVNKRVRTEPKNGDASTLILEVPRLTLASIGFADWKLNCSVWDRLHLGALMMAFEVLRGAIEHAPGDVSLMHQDLLELRGGIVAKLFAVGQFVFPTLVGGEIPFCYLPNPKERYCIDLHRVPDWLAGAGSSARRKWRKTLGTVRLAVDEDFEGALTKLAEYHMARHSGTWLTPEYRARLVQWKTGVDPTFTQEGVTLHTIELRDAATDDIVAAIFGYAVGGAFHDCSMGTFVRDSRGLGHLASRLLGCALAAAGVSMWYWGVELSYMSDYRSLGGVGYSRREFIDRWLAAAAQPPSTTALRTAAATATKAILVSNIADAVPV
jgi:hypothetical protein